MHGLLCNVLLLRCTALHCTALHCAALHVSCLKGRLYGILFVNRQLRSGTLLFPPLARGRARVGIRNTRFINSRQVVVSRLRYPPSQNPLARLAKVAHPRVTLTSTKRFLANQHTHQEDPNARTVAYHRTKLPSERAHVCARHRQAGRQAGSGRRHLRDVYSFFFFPSHTLPQDAVSQHRSKHVVQRLGGQVALACLNGNVLSW